MSYDVFLALVKAHGLPEPETEALFIPGRKFRADYLFRAALVIVEKNGGIWTSGKHGRGGGILRDYEKANLAQLAGFLYLQFTPQQLTLPSTLHTLHWVLGKDSLATRRPA